MDRRVEERQAVVRVLPALTPPTAPGAALHLHFRNHCENSAIVAQMAGRGGKTRTSGQGRPKGVPNKVTLMREAEIKASGLTPLDYMLLTLRDDTATVEDRRWAAQTAAPYVHPRLASIEAKTDATIHEEPSIIDSRLLTREQRHAFRELLLIATGKLAG